MHEADRYLPGDPSGAIVRAVRRHLAHYGIKPQPKLWGLAWRWADAVRRSYCVLRPRWPSPNEIGAQYLALLLSEMRENFALKLPYRAADECPPAVRAALGAGPLALPPEAPKPAALPPRQVETTEAEPEAGRLF